MEIETLNKQHQTDIFHRLNCALRMLMKMTSISEEEFIQTHNLEEK